MLGLLLGRKGASNSEVAAEFREAIRLRPDFAEAQNNLGLVLTQTDQDEPALAAFREAIRIGQIMRRRTRTWAPRSFRPMVNKPFANWRKRSRSSPRR